MGVSLVLHATNLVLKPSQSEVETHMRLVVPVQFILNVVLCQIPVRTTLHLANGRICSNLILLQELD